MRPIVLYCGFCGTALPENASFCEHCGQKSSDNEGPTTQVIRPLGASSRPPLTTQTGQNKGILANQPQTTRRPQRLLIALLVFLLVMVASAGELLYMVWHSSPRMPTGTLTLTNTPTPIATQTSSANPTYPEVAGQYYGTINNTLTNIQTTLSLSIYQAQGNLDGTLTVGPGLLGSGPLTGVIDTAGNL